MRSRSTRGLVVASALVVAACGGRVESAGGGSSGVGSTAQVVGVASGGRDSVSLPVGSPSIARGGGAHLRGRIETDGAIATDGTNVYWTEHEIGGTIDNPDYATPYSIVTCPVAGCGSDGPETFASHVNGGTGIGELVIEGGRLYFQSGPAEDSSRGPIVDCPLTGCGAEPTLFAPIENAYAFSALLTSDGASLFWEDMNNIYACPLGDVCDSPTLVAQSIGNRPADSVALQLVESGGSLYWVAPGGSVWSVPTTGGAVANVCSLPGDEGLLGWGMLAVLDGYVYVSDLGGSIERCALDGGEMTDYATGSLMLSTDGARLYWLTDWGQTSDTTTYLNACEPGASCSGPTRLLGLDARQGVGFTFDEEWIYTVAGTVKRTRR